MSISHYKVVVVTSMKITKTYDKRIGLNLNSKHKMKRSKQEHKAKIKNTKCAKTKYKQIFIAMK
jgi:hypothetical protein